MPVVLETFAFRLMKNTINGPLTLVKFRDSEKLQLLIEVSNAYSLSIGKADRSHVSGNGQPRRANSA